MYSRNYFKSFWLLAVTVLLLPASALAQHTPFAGQVIGAVGNTYGAIADDIITELNEQQKSDRASGRNQALGVQFGGFTMGRLRSTDHDGFESTALPSKVSYSADESSAFAAFFASMPGLSQNSKLTLGAFGGFSRLNIDLDPNADVFAGDPRDPGTADNHAGVYGVALSYAVNSIYMTTTVTGFSGRSEIDDKINGFVPEYDTFGYIVSGIVGNTYALGTVSGAATFLAAEVGARHLDYSGDDYLSQGKIALFSQDLTTTTVMGAVGLYQVYKTANGFSRPYVRASVQKDVRYNSESTIKDLNGANPDVTEFDQARVSGKVELGLNFIQGNLDISAAGFTEFSTDQNTVGGRLGAKINLN